MSDFIVQCNQVSKTFTTGNRKLEVLKDINLKLRHREWLLLVGASGSGKTTLLNILGALETPDKGELLFENKPYKSFNTADFRNKKLGFVFQSYHLLPELNVLENVLLPARLGGNYKAAEYAEYLVERVGLKDRSHHRPGELSGGECQRAAIARALINRPELLLADEPTGNLDGATGKEIMNLFAELHADTALPLSIIMITHNPALAAYADTTRTLADGALLEGDQL